MFRILIADDEKIVVDAVSIILEKNFSDVIFETARSGREAILKSDNFKPHIVLWILECQALMGLKLLGKSAKVIKTHFL